MRPRRRTYSLAAMLLLVTIAGVAAFNLRDIYARSLQGSLDYTLVVAVGGAVCGTIMGLVLAMWNRSQPVWKPGGWPRFIFLTFAGAGVGAASGVQLVVRVPWIVIPIGMAVIVIGAAVVSANRRRQRSLNVERALAVNAPLPEQVHPLDRPD